MKKFFRQLISDKNDINERSFVGVVSFAMMILAFTVDIITGMFGKKLVIEEFVYNSFFMTTSVSFGLTVTEKVFKKSPNSA